jgi:hypothetical protein
MLALKRLWLIIFVLLAPLLMTALLNWAARALLVATNRVIDPQILEYAAIAEFAIFLFVAFLEAKNRWSA